MDRTLLISRVFPPQVGGNGAWMWELYSRLPRKSVLIAAGRAAGWEAFDAGHDLRVVRAPLHLQSFGAWSVRRGGAYYRLYSQLHKLISQHSIQTVHASNFLPEGFLAWMLHRRLGIPYVVFVHGEELTIASSSRELSWMTRRAYGSAQLLIANSRNTANKLTDGWNVPPARVHVMHPGVDTAAFRPAPVDCGVRRRLGWEGRQVILTVGRLTKRKGHELVIRAMPQILAAVPRALYAIVGDGEERSQLERLVAELGLSNHVRFHGEIAHCELLEVFQQCDLFVLANHVVNGDFEGFGIVLLEAQACGKPVIAGNTGGTAEALEDGVTGRIIDVESPRALQQAIVELLVDNDLRARMGDAGRRRVVVQFDWSKLAKDAQELFAQLTAATRSSTSRGG
jgi:phosphatidylinositol alpha-1,6-mannosyltransferase